MQEMINLEAEPRPCCPFLPGVIFYQNGKDVWVVESCDPLEGKVHLGHYRLPPNGMTDTHDE